MARRIAVVTNDLSTMATLHTALLRRGYDVRGLRAGLGVHEVLRHEAPDVIIMSMARGKDALDGLIVQSILDEPALRETPLALYADVLPDDLTDAIDQRHALILMAQPFTPQTAVYAVDRLARIAARPTAAG